MSFKKINILQEEDTYNNNSGSFLFPLLVNRKLLQFHDILLDFFDSLSKKIYDCDILMITSRFAKNRKWWDKENKDVMFSFLSKAKNRVDYLVWADLTDATGTTQFEILPYVDRYLKSFILKDKKLYQNVLYGSRYHSDYYHNKFGIHDTDPGEPHLNSIPETEELEKVKVSWHQAFYNHSHLGYTYMKLKKFFNVLPNRYFINFVSPDKKRKKMLSCRIKANYDRQTVSFQRQKIVEMLNGSVSYSKVNRRRYFHELRNSRVAISPFGWGETSYRDYDIIISGATLMKPDCDHLETWPNFYKKNKTYLSFKWDFSDFVDIIESLPDRLDYVTEMAHEAQDIYRHYLLTKEGRNKFCERFKTLMEFNKKNVESTTYL